MLQGLYSIRDRVACEFGPVQHCKNDAVAVRMFQQATEKVSFPGDYDLFCVGTMDMDTGHINAFVGPRQVPIVVEGHIEDQPSIEELEQRM